MDNLQTYNKVRTVPKEALRTIDAGRLKGKSDINPVWRIKTLTEQFGVCGFGWKYEITDKRLEHGGNNEIAAFVDIKLYVKVNGEWSEAIPGTGGSSFVANEKNGPYVSDECFKMALTDAISVACKALGVGADVYWEKDSSKYDKPTEQSKGKPEEKPAQTGAKPQPSDLEKRATAFYYNCTGTKEGQRGWSQEDYKAFLKTEKEAGHISTDYGKKWTEADLDYLEETVSALPF